MPDFTYYEAPARNARELPHRVPGKLHGRDAVMAQVYGVLKSNKPVGLYGPAGVGKTSVALMLASAYSELPGGALWLRVNDSSLDELIVRVGRAYFDDEITGAEQPLGMIGAVTTTLSSQKPLIVLDGVHNLSATSQFISRCAAGLPVMLISNEPLEGWPGVTLGNLETAPSMDLLRQFGELAANTSEDDLDEVASILDYNPFALRIAAGMMRAGKQSPADYLKAFEQIPSSAGASPQLLALTVAFKSLNPALQGIMLLMGATFGGTASAELLSAISGAPQETVESVMKMLTDQGLVDTDSRYNEPYYTLHELAYTFAGTWLRGSGKLDSTREKVRESLVAYARKYSMDSPGAHNKLACEMDQIIAMARWSADQGDREPINQIVLQLTQAGDFVSERGYLHELLQLRKSSASHTTAFPAYPAPAAASESDLPFEEDDDLEDIVEADAAAALPTSAGLAARPPEDLLEDELDDDDLEDIVDEEDEPDLLPEDTGNVEVPVAAVLSPLAKLQADLRAAKQAGDLRREADLHNKLGDLQVEQGLETEALVHYGDALSAWELVEDKAGELDTLDKLATLAVKTENTGAAVMHATRGVRLAAELGDDETRMFLLTALGDARQQAGESNEAVKAYAQALEIARNDGDSQNDALLLFKLGYAHLDNSDADAAAQSWEQAVKLFQAQGKRAYEGKALGGLGTAYGELERWEEAIRFHTSALYIAREMKDREEESLQLSYLGYACTQANKLGEAVTRYRQALHLAYQMDKRADIVTAVVDLARLLTRSRKHLSIAELLVDDGLKADPNNRDLTRLKEKLGLDKVAAIGDGVELLPASGTAKEYAANAYKLLDES
jgi:tetratricopeptide (TPR) repeat protein/energy-coupling factor transporter ATP-binding protein EcfA2